MTYIGCYNDQNGRKYGYLINMMTTTMFETVEIKDVKIEIGSLVKALRKQRGMSQIQLAESLNVSRTTIRNLELGKNFTIDTLLKVAQELDLIEQLNTHLVQFAYQVRHTKSLY